MCSPLKLWICHNGNFRSSKEGDDSEEKTQIFEKSSTFTGYPRGLGSVEEKSVCYGLQVFSVEVDSDDNNTQYNL